VQGKPTYQQTQALPHSNDQQFAQSESKEQTYS